MAPGFRAHLPAPVHAPDAKAGIASAVGQTDVEIWAGIHHPAKHKRGKRHRPVHQVADGVGQVIARGPLGDQGQAGLMDEQQGSHLFPAAFQKGKNSGSSKVRPLT